MAHPNGQLNDLRAVLGLLCGIRWPYIDEYLESFRATGLLAIQRASNAEMYAWLGVPKGGEDDEA